MSYWSSVALFAGGFICGCTVANYVLRKALIGSVREIASDEQVAEAFRRTIDGQHPQ